MSKGHQSTEPLQADPLQAAAEAAVHLTFEEIFKAEASQVGRTLRYLGVREANVEDACQEVFIVAHRRLSQFQGGSARAWIRQICVHVANNQRRSQRRHPEDCTADPPEVTVQPEQYLDAERRQQRRQLLALLEQLPQEQRDVFVLFEIEELTMPKTAEAVGCALQTAYSRLYAARKKMQALLQGIAT